MLSSPNTTLSASNQALEALHAKTDGTPTLKQSNSMDGPNPWEQALRLIQQRQGKLRETLGPVSGQELAKLSGLQAMTAQLEGRTPVFAMGRTLNFHLIEVKYGEVIFQGLPSENAYNTLGVVHAGWFASVLESALSGAIHSLLSCGQWCTTSDFNLHLINGVNPQTGPLRAQGTALHIGAHSASARA